MNAAVMDLNAVRMLVRVAEARSFTAAAGQLGLSQSGCRVRSAGWRQGWE